MPELVISGTVLDRGQNLSKFVQLNMLITLWREDKPVSHVFEADVTTGGNGGFTYTVEIKPKVEEEFTVSGSAASGSGTASGLIAVDLTAYVPGATTLHYQSAVVAVFSRGQTFVGMANSLVDTLRYDLDLDGLNTITVNGILDSSSTTKKAFEDVDGMIVELMHIPPPSSIQILGWLQTIRHGSEVAASAPTMRNGNTYTARLFYDPDPLADGQQYFRVRSDGPDFSNQVIARTPVLPSSWLPGLQTAPFVPSNPYEAVLIARVDEAIGIGSISAQFPDRTFAFPFILKEPDLDFTAGKIRVRGEVGIGTGKNLILFTIAHFEALFAVTPVNYEASPFLMSELKNFFQVSVSSSSVDVLPGTDLDDLPWWVYATVAGMRVALGLGPGLAGAALIIAAIEAIFKPVVSDLVEKHALAAINDQLEERVTQEIDDRIEEAADLAAAAGQPLSDKAMGEMKANVWVEAEKITIDANDLHITGWAGVLHDLVNGLQDSIQDASCPFNAAAGQASTPPPATPPSTLQVFRDFKDLLDVESLKPWMRRYEGHRAELLRIVQAKPRVVERLVRVSRATHKATRTPGWRMPGQTVSGFAELCKELRSVCSPELGRFIDDLDDIISKGLGKSVDDLKAVAAARLPATPDGRPVPPHRMGRGPVAGLRASARRPESPSPKPPSKPPVKSGRSRRPRA